MSTIRLDQMSLVVGILELVDAQAKARGIKKYCVSTGKMNAICKAATEIVLEFDREEIMATPAMGLDAWLASDDTGRSSNAMAHHMLGAGSRGATPYDLMAHPIDPDDFGRCHRLLEADPGSREQLYKMRRVSSVWARLVDAWDELTALYLEELPTGKAPKLYARMKEIGA